MEDKSAAIRADDFIKLILQHQPSVFGVYHPLTAEDRARKVAQSIAALRAELITQLLPQS